jgi:hypothetical protein
MLGKWRFSQCGKKSVNAQKASGRTFMTKVRPENRESAS